MARETGRAALILSELHRQTLSEMSGSRTVPAREVERAEVLLRYADGSSISDIQRQVGVSRPTIYKCIDKALSAGVAVGLKDTFHSPKEPEILADAEAWVVSLACTQPKDHGLAAELWTLSALVRQVRKCAVEAGFPRLTQVGKTTVWRILNEQNIKPHRIRYYLQKRDPEFDRKMREVLLVYQEVALYARGTPQEIQAPPVYTVSVDEKPGVQGIGLTAPDLPVGLSAGEGATLPVPQGGQRARQGPQEGPGLGEGGSARDLLRAGSRLAAKQALERFAGTWKAIYPDAVACVEKDLDALIAFLAFPENEWASLRTTNGIERLNKEFKRRTKPMEIVAGEASVYRILAFVAMKMELSWRKAPFRNSGFRKLKPFA